jgi:hypothetical protein
MFQVMGFNYSVDWPNIDDFVQDMFVDESRHLKALLGYLGRNHLEGYVRSHDWEHFARGYNGIAYAQNHYDERMANAFMRISADRRAHRLPP